MIPGAGELGVRYLGWSSFEILFPGGQRCYFDANHSTFDAESYSHREDYAAADIYFVTHGHFDHCQDLPSLAGGNRGLVVTSPALARFFTRKHHLDDSRLAGVDGDCDFHHAAIRISARRWVHRTLIDRWPALLARRPGGLLKMRAALRCFLTSPLLGFRLEAPGTTPLTLIGEAFQGRTDLDRLRQAGREQAPGVTLVALEPGLEAELARATAAFAPATVLAYSGHAAMWDYFGLPRVDATRFRDELASLAPGLPAHFLEPRAALRIGPGGEIA